MEGDTESVEDVVAAVVVALVIFSYRTQHTTLLVPGQGQGG